MSSRGSTFAAAPITTAIGAVATIDDVDGKCGVDVRGLRPDGIEDGTASSAAASSAAPVAPRQNATTGSTAKAAKAAQNIIEVKGAMGGGERSLIVDGSTRPGPATSAMSATATTDTAIATITTIATGATNDPVGQENAVTHPDITKAVDRAASGRHRNRTSTPTTSTGAVGDIGASAGSRDAIAARCQVV